MRRFVLLVLLTSLGLPALAQPTDTVQARLLTLLNAKVVHKGKHPIHGIQLYLGQPDRAYVLATGWADARTQQPAHPDDQFKIASITKTMTATVILQLAEQGLVDLDAPAARYLHAVPWARMNEVHLYRDTAYGEQITVRQLLNHRSGIADLFEDSGIKFYVSQLLHKQREWSPQLLMERYYRYKLNRKAHFKPGAGFRYSDTNYFLLGILAEQVSGKTLAELMRSGIIEPLAMRHSYFEYYEPSRSNGHTTHAMLNRMDVTRKMNTSYDWAGGGVVSTTSDLAVFLRGLFAGKLFRNPATLADMTQAIEHTYPSGRKSAYGLGIYRWTYNQTTFYGHGGFWGTHLMYSPDLDLAFCINVNQVNPQLKPIEFIGQLLAAYPTDSTQTVRLGAGR